MDPTRIIGKAKKSFELQSDQTDEWISDILDGWFNSSDQPKNDLKDDIIAKDISEYKLEIENVDVDKYEELQQLKDKFEDPRFVKARSETNPVEGIGKGIFLNRAAIKLANIDAIFKLSKYNIDFLTKTSSLPFIFADVAGGPGGFTEYLQYRLPNSVGYGITLKSGLPWNMNKLDMNYFNITYGRDETGNVFTNSDYFSEWVLSKNREGVDLVVSDGGFETDDRPRQQEILSAGLILHEILIALMILKPNGNFLVKVFDTVTPISADLIYLITLCFDETYMFKPLSSRPANSERYLVAKSKKPNIDHYIRILKSASIWLNKGKNIIITRLFKDLPSDFKTWLYRNNMNNYNLQFETANNIISYMNKTPITIPLYDCDKCLVTWNLPHQRYNKSN